jgi:hypothetical protein
VELWEIGNEGVNQVGGGLEYGSVVDIGFFFVCGDGSSGSIKMSLRTNIYLFIYLFIVCPMLIAG